MALKMDREVDAVDLTYFMNETAERGVIVSVSTAGSGIAMDNPKNVATVAAAASGSRPIGMLLNDVSNVDRTRFHINYFKDVMAVGDKVTIATKGWFVTDKVVGTPSAGQLATLAHSGYVQATSSVVNPTATPFVGRFRSSKNESGFAKVYVDL